MTTSPLQLARAFAALKSSLATQPVGDLRLLNLADFWSNIADRRGNPSYQSYVDEFAALFDDALRADDLADCTPDELVRIRCVAMEAASPDQRERIHMALARTWAYAGEIERAVQTCAEAAGEVEVVGASTAANGERAGTDETTQFSERERLIAAIEQIKDIVPTTAARSEQIAAEWEDETGHLWFDRVRCLLVETNGDDRPRGRMRTLIGAVEPIGKRLHRPAGPQSDEVTFEGQLRTPDDLFIGVVYNSLKSVRPLLQRPGMLPISTARRNETDTNYHAHYQLESNGHTVAGDSIGLAAALIAYTQLLRPEVMRHERFVSSEVAFTGSIDPDGRLLPVNPSTLPTKLERAFFSPVRYVVVPAANESDARTALVSLSQRYPHRRLRLIVAERLTEVVENFNVVRSERVCMGSFVAKKTVKYARMTKLHVPLLALLIYTLLAITWTKTFAPWWFDWNPVNVRIVGDRFEALNSEGQSVWVSEPYEGMLDTDFYNQVSAHGRHMWEFADIDGDQSNEVFFVPKIGRSFFDVTKVELWDDGTMLHSCSTYRTTAYPGDVEWDIDAQDLRYSLHQIRLIPMNDSTSYLLTESHCSSPIRNQLMLFDSQLKLVAGPYVHTGGSYLESVLEVENVRGDDSPEVLFGCTNNRYNRAGLLVLNPLELSGVSPPYSDVRFVASGMPRGSQLYYVAFPETRLSRGDDIRNCVSAIFPSAGSGALQVIVVEGTNSAADTGGVAYLALPRITYELDSNFIPTRCLLGDGMWERMNPGLARVGGEPYESQAEVLDSLLREVIVYHGDSIVHHEAAGVVFNQ